MADAVASGPEVCGFRSEHLRGAMELFAAEGWDTYTADPERTLRALTAPGSTTVVAVDGGAVAALVQLQSDGEIQAHLSALVVGERWRRRGLGRTLLREALERAGGLRIDLITRAGDYYLAIGAEPVPRLLTPAWRLGWRATVTAERSRHSTAATCSAKRPR